MDEAKRRDCLIRWLDTIAADIEGLLLDDHIFWELQNVVEGNQRFTSSSGLFTQWTARAFVQATAVGVRRQAKCDDDSVSLKRFLREVQKYPCLVSRAHYLGFFEGKHSDLIQGAQEEFNEIRGESADIISAARVLDHLEKLDRGVKRIEEYADRRLAHYDLRGLSQPVPKFGDLGDSLNTLEQTVLFYKQFLQGYTMNTLLPTIQFDWLNIFSFAWVPPKNE